MDGTVYPVHNNKFKFGTAGLLSTCLLYTSIEWSMWQAEQLKALEKYKRENQKRYSKQFKSINGQIGELLYQSRQTGNMQQEIQILKAIQRGYRFPNMPKKLFGLLEEMDGKTFRQKASLLVKRWKGKEAAQALSLIHI